MDVYRNARFAPTRREVIVTAVVSEVAERRPVQAAEGRGDLRACKDTGNPGVSNIARIPEADDAASGSTGAVFALTTRCVPIQKRALKASDLPRPSAVAGGAPSCIEHRRSERAQQGPTSKP